jgi:hypothetical protein
MARRHIQFGTLLLLTLTWLGCSAQRKLSDGVKYDRIEDVRSALAGGADASAPGLMNEAVRDRNIPILELLLAVQLP